MKHKNKKSFSILLIISILFISMGFALLSTNLRINGFSRIDDITWDVHFENVQVSDSSTVTPNVAPKAPAADKLQIINYDVSFDIPGQVYEFTVDVVNSGSIDAMIESFTSKIKIEDGDEEVIADDKSNFPECLDYDVTYSDGTAVSNNHILSAASSETIKVRLEFKRDITNELVESMVGKVIALNISLNFKQPEKITLDLTTKDVYVVSDQLMAVGRLLPSTVNQRSSVESVMTDWGTISGNVNDKRYLFLRQSINKRKVILSSSIGFVVTEDMAENYSGMVPGIYYLKAGKGEYENNVEILKYAFGCLNGAEERCHYSYFEPSPNQSSYEARIFGYNGKSLVVTSYVSGRVDVNDGSRYCLVSERGISECQ